MSLCEEWHLELIHEGTLVAFEEKFGFILQWVSFPLKKQRTPPCCFLKEKYVHKSKKVCVRSCLCCRSICYVKR